MRNPGEIRKQILVIRDKNQLTMTTICQRARVSRHEIVGVLAMRGSEDALRKLDAFLDAPKLHQRDRSQTVIAYEIENLSREMWRQFEIKSLHPNYIAKCPYDKQRLILNEMTWKAKAALQRKILAENGLVVKVPDGATYWQYKERCIHRIRGEEAVRTRDRNSRRVPWPRPVREDGPL